MAGPTLNDIIARQKQKKIAKTAFADGVKAFGGGVLNAAPEIGYWVGKAGNYALGETGAISEKNYQRIGDGLDYWNNNPTPFDSVNAEWARLRRVNPDAASLGEIFGAGGLAKLGVKTVMGAFDKVPRYTRSFIPDWNGIPDWLKYAKLSPNKQGVVAATGTTIGEAKGEELLKAYYNSEQNDGR